MAQSTHGVIWYELLTTQLDDALKFYRAVLGWTTAGSNAPGMDYRHIKLGDDNIGGAMAIPAEAAAHGMQPLWVPYIHVDDVEASIKRIAAAGGAIHMPASPIPGAGTLSMVSDPQGAMFYIMAPAGQGESPSFRPYAPGHGGWHELHTSDRKAALAFYRDQFGWVALDETDMGPLGMYQQFNSGAGESIGGMMNDPAAPRPYWLVYFNVDDVDAALRRLRAANGTLLMGPQAVPGGGWIAHCRDPQGALFALTGPRK